MPGPNLLKNGDFEQGKTYWRSFGGAFDVSRVGQAEGDLGAILVAGFNPSNFQLFQSGIALKGGTYYELTFTARERFFGNNMRVRVHKHTAPYTNRGLDAPVGLTKVAGRKRVVFRTPDGPSTTDNRLQLQIAGYNFPVGLYIFDDVVLREIAPPHSASGPLVSPAARR